MVRLSVFTRDGIFVWDARADQSCAALLVELIDTHASLYPAAMRLDQPACVLRRAMKLYDVHAGELLQSRRVRVMVDVPTILSVGSVFIENETVYITEVGRLFTSIFLRVGWGQGLPYQTSFLRITSEDAC